MQGVLFGMHDGVGPLGIERAGDGLGRILVGEAFLLAPQLAGVDQRALAPVDAASFWVHGYFRESLVGDMRAGDACRLLEASPS